ncbi:hypothetical protein MTO96_043423 [Rhipicephalus appendiculatus]
MVAISVVLPSSCMGTRWSMAGWGGAEMAAAASSVSSVVAAAVCCVFFAVLALPLGAWRRRGVESFLVQRTRGREVGVIEAESFCGRLAAAFSFCARVRIVVAGGFRGALGRLVAVARACVRAVISSGGILRDGVRHYR